MVHRAMAGSRRFMSRSDSRTAAVDSAAIVGAIKAGSVAVRVGFVVVEAGSMEAVADFMAAAVAATVAAGVTADPALPGMRAQRPLYLG